MYQNKLPRLSLELDENKSCTFLIFAFDTVKIKKKKCKAVNCLYCILNSNKNAPFNSY